MVLDNVSMHNVGAAIPELPMLFGGEKLFFVALLQKPPHREIHKAALGATESVDWQF